MEQPYLKTPEPEGAAPSRLGEWPNSPAKRGKFYAVNDPVHNGEKLCVLSWDSWVDVGTVLKKNELVMKAQDGKVKELKATVDALAAQLRDANERLRNLRRVRRKELRADIERDNPELAQADTATPAQNLPTTGTSYL